MTALALLEETRHLGLRLSIRGDKLRIEPPPGPELIERLKAAKSELMALLASENASEYVAERTAICAADGLPPRAVRPVFEYVLADRPGVPLIMLGVVGETPAEAQASLFDRFGRRLLRVTVYQWPPAPLREGLQ